MNGNCGCFGQMIPMTPLEAFIKNVLTLGLLFWLYRITEENSGKHRFSILLLIWSLSSLLMFSVFPFAPNKGIENTTPTNTENIPWEEDSTSTSASQTSAPTVDNTNPTTPAVLENSGPYPAESKFAKLNVFGNKRVKIDEGKRIVCFFVPGCDHCREAAKGLTELAKDPSFPPVYVYFMDEEVFLIDDFFKYAGKKYPYQILDVPTFWQLMGTQNETPGVVYLWNGNIRKEFYGSDGFNKEALKAACNQAQ
jgi:thiol-disulfide isomerase/thioredoxin